MEHLTLVDLRNRRPFDANEIPALVGSGLLKDPCFRACNFSCEVNGVNFSRKNSDASENLFLLFFSYLDESMGKWSDAYLSNVNSRVPKTFKTPQALMSTAHKVGIRRYSIDAEHWTASHFNIYKKMVELAKVRNHE